MNGRGFLWIDALSRSTSALMVLYSTDPHLAAVGFIWMPLPSFLEMLWVIAYPLWPGIVSSGFASTFASALAGGATAAILLRTVRAFGLSESFGWAFALLVSFGPMLFMYGSNGMSEGIASPCLVGCVAALTLFWRTARRQYVVISGLALALAFATLYQAVHYGALLFAAFLLGVLVPSAEHKGWAPRGRWPALQGLGLVFLLPAVYVAVLWVGANWMIMGDPLFFATSTYSNAGHVAAAGAATGGISRNTTGDLPGTILFIAARTAPFAIPGLFLLLLRALDGRLFRINTLSLSMLLCMPFAFNAPFVYDGTSFGFLRYFMYPLFVAAGWGPYEVYLSERRAVAKALVLAGWALAAPVILWVMNYPSFGAQESRQVRSAWTGQKAEQTVFYDVMGQASPVPNYLEKEIFPKGGKVVVDAFRGWPIAAQIPPDDLRHRLIMSPDRRFQRVLAKPDEYGVRYFLVSDPNGVPQDVILRKYPKMWEGKDPAFKLVKTIPKSAMREEWRLYEFFPPGSEAFDENLDRRNGRVHDPKEGRPMNVSPTGPRSRGRTPKVASKAPASFSPSGPKPNECCRP